MTLRKSVAQPSRIDDDALLFDKCMAAKGNTAQMRNRIATEASLSAGEVFILLLDRIHLPKQEETQ
jgi:hypothetical protein